MKQQTKQREHKLREGEFISPTQKPISAISSEALSVRAKGMKKDYKEIDVKLGNKDNVQNLIASMNYSVQQVMKELKQRGDK